jgi:ppGpp synthetase/RelA/SpoT-type nucleotidyltranferase
MPAQFGCGWNGSAELGFSTASLGTHVGHSYRGMLLMSDEIKTEYPGGSKSRVNKAGHNIKTGVATQEDYAVFETWRSAHRQVLNTFQAYFRIATKRNFQENFIIAQRHKRKSTIINKLSRHPKMMLSRMDDIAGCRLIFDDIASLNKFRSQMHNNHFKHVLRNSPEKYDYIAKPKGSGYRGIHDVYEYKTTSAATRGSNGLYITTVRLNEWMNRGKP